MLECAADIGDETLLLRAQEYLRVLDREEYAALNRPACLDGLIARGKGMSRGRSSPDFSIRVLFETMLRVTDELDGVREPVRQRGSMRLCRARGLARRPRGR